MKKNVVQVFLAISVLVLTIGCGVGKLAIKKRFAQKPKVGIHSNLGMLSISRGGGSQDVKLEIMPKEYEKIATEIIVDVMKKEWQNDKISYVGNNNLRDYDLLVYVFSYGVYNVACVSKPPCTWHLEVETAIRIFDPHASKNLTGLAGETLGKVKSKSIKAKGIDEARKKLSPESLLPALKKKVEEGLKKYIEDVKAAKE